MSAELLKLSEGVEGIFIKNMRFNTTLISFNFYLPMGYETVADNALLPFILTTCSKKYPDFSRLNYKLNKLYGAELSASAEKVGDLQLLKMSISVINDEYTLDNEPLCKTACELLCDMIFEPMVQNGSFTEEDVEREKRKAIEHIRGEMSEKRTFAKARMIEEMYRGRAYGVPKCGTEEQVSAVTGESLYRAWENMLKSAFVRVNVVSGKMPQGLFENITDRFSQLERNNVTDVHLTQPTESAECVNTVTDYMDVAQGKLVMGFSTEMSGTDENTLPLLVMCDMFGGGPYSALFANVREKMSLCYYCSASAIRAKGLITVDSGVEGENAEKTRLAVLEQLEEIKHGRFGDFEFDSSKKSIIDSMKAYDDSQHTLDNWYSIKIANHTLLSPQDVAEGIARVDRDSVIKAAGGVKLHTVYKLMPLSFKKEEQK